MVSRRSSRAVGNNSGFFDTINSKFSSDKNYTYLASLLGFVLFVALMNIESNGNQITGATIDDITGSQSAVTPITNILKDIVGAIVGPDGILATVFVNLTTNASWLPAVAVVMMVSVMFYLILRKSIMRGDEHKKAVFLLSLALGLLSIGISIGGQTLVDWFKNLIEGTIIFTVVLVLAFAFWIFALWGIRGSSKAWGKMHESSVQRLGTRRAQLLERSGKSMDKTMRKEQKSLNKIVAKYATQYNNASSEIFKSKAEKEFRSKVAKSCPEIEPKIILQKWNAALSNSNA